MGKITWLLGFLLCVSSINALTPVKEISETLYNGQSKVYSINGVDYSIEAMYTNEYQSYSVFRVNGEIKQFKEMEPTSIGQDVEFRVDEIYEQPYSERTAFTLLIYSLCGDGSCNNEETCSTCSTDCSCQKGYKCKEGICVEKPICGDGICALDEECEEDNCCGGEFYNITSDEKNCGFCDQECNNGLFCIQGECQESDSFCEDGICNGNENCGTCANDCKCAENMRCESNTCVSYCGNGICEVEERKSCKSDCKWCGDKKCNENETFESCPVDCKRSSVCGDSICESDENCCLDCGCSKGYGCINNSCKEVECNFDSDCSDNESCISNSCVSAETEPNSDGQSKEEGVKEEGKKSAIRRMFSWFFDLWS